MVRHRINSNCNVVFGCVRIPICKIEGSRMKNLLIVMVCAASASILISVIARLLSVDISPIIPGAIGGAAGAAVAMKLWGKQTKNK